MTRRFRSIGLAMVALGLGACAAAPKVDLEAEKAAIKAVGDNFAAGMNQKNVDAVVAMYTDDAVLYPLGAATVQGKEGIKSFLTGMTQLPGFADFAVTSEQTDIASSGDFAVDRGTFSLTMTGPNGPMTNSGRYVVALKKVDGAWKLFLDTDNSPTPPAAPAAAPAPAAPAK